MRVAFLTPEIDAAYGWARYAHDLAAALAAQGVDVIALTQRGARAGPPGVPVRDVLPQLVPPVRLFLARLLAALPSARGALRGCDVVHVVAEPYAPLGAWLAAGGPGRHRARHVRPADGAAAGRAASPACVPPRAPDRGQRITRRRRSGRRCPARLSP